MPLLLWADLRSTRSSKAEGTPIKPRFTGVPSFYADPSQNCKSNGIDQEAIALCVG